MSGTTRFSSGFPVTLYNATDTSLLGTFGNGVNNNLLDTPNYTPGCDLQDQPRSGEGAGVQHGVLQPAAARPARQRAAPVLLRPGHRELRPGADQERAARRIAGRCSSASRRSTSSTIRSSTARGAVDGNIASPTFGQIVAGRRAAGSSSSPRNFHSRSVSE